MKPTKEKNSPVTMGVEVSVSAKDSNPKLIDYLNIICDAHMNVVFDPINNLATLKLSEYPCSVRHSIPLRTALLASESDAIKEELVKMRKELDELLLKEKAGSESKK